MLTLDGPSPSRHKGAGFGPPWPKSTRRASAPRSACHGAPRREPAWASALEALADLPEGPAGRCLGDCLIRHAQCPGNRARRHPESRQFGRLFSNLEIGKSLVSTSATVSGISAKVRIGCDRVHQHYGCVLHLAPAALIYIHRAPRYGRRWSVSV